MSVVFDALKSPILNVPFARKFHLCPIYTLRTHFDIVRRVKFMSAVDSALEELATAR